MSRNFFWYHNMVYHDSKNRNIGYVACHLNWNGVAASHIKKYHFDREVVMARHTLRSKNASNWYLTNAKFSLLKKFTKKQELFNLKDTYAFWIKEVLPKVKMGQLFVNRIRYSIWKFRPSNRIQNILSISEQFWAFKRVTWRFWHHQFGKYNN